MLVSAVIISALGIPTSVRSAVALYKVHKAGQLKWGASTTCILFCGLSSTFGLIYIWNDFLGPIRCSQDAYDELSNLFFSACTSLFAMFVVCAMIQVLLMW